MKNNKLYLSIIVLLTLIIVVGGVFYVLNVKKSKIYEDSSTNVENLENNNVDNNQYVVYKAPTLYELCMDNYKEIAAECEAYKNNDPTICDNFIDGNVKLWCKAKVSGDNSYCSDLDPNFSDHEDCYIDTAKTVADCDAITSYHKDYERNECYAFVNKDESLCQGPDYDRIACIAEVRQDSSLCEQSEAFLERWDCKIAIDHDKEGFCQEYHKAFCDEFYAGK